MLLELGIGDSYGVSFEYANEMLHLNTGEHYHQHPRHLGLKPGMYSDDCQMSIALAEMIIRGSPWNREAIADKFVEVFRRDPRDGYSRGFQKILNEVKTGKELLSRIDGNSYKSGAAMRAAPCGLFDNKLEVLKRATIQAKVTHNSDEGIISAQAAALMSFYFHRTLGAKADVGKYLNDNLIKFCDWDADWQGKVSLNGSQPVRAAITAIKRNTSRKALLIDCVAFTGDVDTTAAIAMGCSAPCHEITSDIPDSLFGEFENGKYGRDYLLSLDKKLISPNKEEVPVPEKWRLAPAG